MPSAPSWEELLPVFGPSAAAAAALACAQALQRALARAVHEGWSSAALEAHLASSGLPAARCEAAAAFWAKEREGLLEAASQRSHQRPLLRGAPDFSITTTSASSEAGSVAGEPVAVLSLHTASEALHVEASRGVLASAIAALAGARKAAGGL
jgi:hypothetical protein